MNSERSTPVCLTRAQYAAIERFAKQNGMLSTSQALENILERIDNQ